MKDKFIVMNVALVVLGILGLVAIFTFATQGMRDADAAFKRDCMERGGVVLNYQCVYTEKEALQ